MKYKATLRIPTSDLYAFLEIAVEDTPDAIVSAYKEFTALVKPLDGLPTKEWNDLLVKYIEGGGMSAEDNEKMGKAQQWWIKEFDKALARLQSKENKLHKITE